MMTGLMVKQMREVDTNDALKHVKKLTDQGVPLAQAVRESIALPAARRAGTLDYLLTVPSSDLAAAVHEAQEQASYIVKGHRIQNGIILGFAAAIVLYNVGISMYREHAYTKKT